MDHMFGSRWLIDELFRLGFSVLYNEVNRFRQAVVQSESIEQQLLPETFPGSFSQWVADNVDHNLASIDGCGSFRGMGVMVISTPTKNSTGRVASQNAINPLTATGHNSGLKSVVFEMVVIWLFLAQFCSFFVQWIGMN